MREQRTKVTSPSKQAKLTEDGFRYWWSQQHDPTAGDIWQYFQREFPREAARKEILRELDYQDSVPRDVRLPNAVIADMICSRLRNGGEDKIDMGKQYNSMFGIKPVCPTCGGSGEVPCDVAYPDRDCAGHTVPCPKCKPKGPICLKCGYEGGSSVKFWESRCKHVYVDQRKGREVTTRMNYAGGESYQSFYYLPWGGGEYKDRRK